MYLKNVSFHFLKLIIILIQTLYIYKNKSRIYIFETKKFYRQIFLKIVNKFLIF